MNKLVWHIEINGKRDPESFEFFESAESYASALADDGALKPGDELVFKPVIEVA